MSGSVITGTVHDTAEERPGAHAAEKHGVEISHPASFFTGRRHVPEKGLGHGQVHGSGNALKAPKAY